MKALYNTAFDAASLTLAAGAVQAAWPLANLQDTRRKKVLKTDGTGNIIIRVEFAAPQTCDALALVEFDLRPATPVIVRAYSDAWITPILEHAAEALGPLRGWKEGGWRLFGWKGYPSATELDEFPGVTTLIEFAATYAANWEIEIQNGATSDDAFYLGRLLLGQLWAPARPVSYGYVRALEDSSSQERSLGGVVYTDVGEQYWRLELTLEGLRTVDAFDDWVRFAKAVGIRKDFVFQLLDRGDLKQQRMTTLYGRLTKSPEISAKSYNRNACKLEIEEAL